MLNNWVVGLWTDIWSR